MKQNVFASTKVQLKAYSKRDLIELYDVSWKVLKVWLKPYEQEIGPRVGHFYTPKQAKVILDKLGIPEVIVVNKGLNSLNAQFLYISGSIFGR